ncbi:hypothetical protein ACT17Q_15370 [Cellulomonas sp. CW35]
MTAQNTPPWTVGQIPAGSAASVVRDITPTETITIIRTANSA